MGPDLAVFLVLAIVLPLLQNVVDVGDRVRVDISSILSLAAMAIVGPVGASLAGAVTGAFTGRHLAPRIRLFNAATFALYRLLGGVAFQATGGTTAPSRLSEVSAVVLSLALPMLVASVVQLAVNLVLVAGVVRVSHGVPMRLQMASMLQGTGLAYLGFSLIAIPLVVLWKPAGLGPEAVIIVLAPLLVAQWAYRQHAEELEGQQRALEVLVAAVEAKAPHLAGHSSRVAELSARMAEHLGLSPQFVADTRMAGMLHDVGQTSLSTRVVRDLDLTDPSGGQDGYPEAGVALLDDLTFLRGALDPIRWHREALGSVQSSLPSRIVALADRYDLLTTVGSPGGTVQASALARDLVAAEVVGADAAVLVRALDEALARVRSDQSPT
ncbi:HD domain-containing protein [Phycicoccus sp. HDW14]|uniref:HD-GYP domain-containing protein n=1 Tax=Phycicoccus sp. HDW14 TaxID=2714941 RepID=UPI00140DC7AA|nr:HD domain-containing protein [Phycicoccus sp. HDW14]QIM20270.1 HD domain-containing protein [Phycicoccus sp. HDW14]